ncbi:MAG: hypothetical protein WBQ94_24705 [Terracidiphilus sp.]
MKIIKSAFVFGVAISSIALVAAVVLLVSPYTSRLSHVSYLFFGFGLPGMLFEAWAMSSHEPHGGGTPLEMLCVVFPINVIFYSLLAYIVLRIARAALNLRATISRPPKG